MQNPSPIWRLELSLLLSISALLAVAGAAPAASAPASPRADGWQRTVEFDPAGLKTEEEFFAALKAQGVESKGHVNYFCGRWISITFMGGQCLGGRSEDFEFFYQRPFRYYNQVADMVLTDGGDVYGMRAKLPRYKEASKFQPYRSFLLNFRCDNLLDDYYPSYILVNGRRVWDAKLHPRQKGKILVPFSLAEGVEPVIDFVVDKGHTPQSRGLASRMFFVFYLGDPGVKVDLKGAADAPEKSPADTLDRFTFGLFPTTYDFWGKSGTTFAQIREKWKPNFRPEYPTDEVFLSPFTHSWPSGGKYEQFMVTYGGCNVVGRKPDPALAKSSPLIRAVLTGDDPAENKAVSDLGLQPHWFRGEHGVFATDPAAHRAAMQRDLAKLQKAKDATGQAGKIRTMYEPFPPALTSAHEYERGYDMIILKNEESPQHNILVSMSRGAGRSFAKPFGYYWEQTHYPYPSLDQKLHACLLYYFAGGSWIGAEAEHFPSFDSEVVAEPVLPYVQAMRFAMVHPARGTPVVRNGILWGQGDRWTIPFNQLAHFDTFSRNFDYDHASKTIKTQPTIDRRMPWIPEDRAKWNFTNSAHLGYYLDHVPEMRGYDLLDVFFPQYGDAFTAKITRLLTGTPHGPVDFVYADAASADHLKSFGLLAALGHLRLDDATQAKLTDAANAGATVLVGAQHFQSAGGKAEAFGLALGAEKAVSGDVSGADDMYSGRSPGHFKGNIFAGAPDWQVVAKVGDSPLLVRRAAGKGWIYVYLGRWIHEGSAALRPVLAKLAGASAPLQWETSDDQLEYIPYRKGAGAWVAIFNHGNIAIGCDRLKELRATPPEPLVSKPKGAYQGKVSFRLDQLGLNPAEPLALYEVVGIDGEAFERVISGHGTFTFRKVPADLRDGALVAQVRIDKRAQYLVAPEGKAEAVFFGK